MLVIIRVLAKRRSPYTDVQVRPGKRSIPEKLEGNWK
jgi:hypothetical protein